MTSCGSVLKNGVTAVVGVLAVAAGGLSIAGVAHAAQSFNGTYTAVLKSAGQPDEVSLWNVTSDCGFSPCLAYVVSKAHGTDWLFDGSQWKRVAVPLTGTCNGQTVPARSVSQTFAPRGDGTFHGVFASSVDCNGTTVNSAQTLTLTPS